MKNQYPDPEKKEIIDLVSRKSNEEIDEDEIGRLIIGGQTEENAGHDPNHIIPSFEGRSSHKKENDFEGIED